MKRLAKIGSVCLVMALVLVSCNSKPSIQKYYIEKHEDGNFISIDIPSSIVSLNDDATEEMRASLASIKKLNILAFQVNESNQAQFETESKTVNQILNDDKFNDLMRAKHQGINIQVKYLGNDESIDELIVYAKDPKKGFALARVLGDEMKPGKILKLLDNIKDVDKDNPALAQIGQMFGDK